MKLSTTTAWAATAVFNANRAYSAATSFCPGNSDICFQWGVPETAAKSGSGNVYIQLKAPTSYQWIGLGIGNQMAGAHMFLMYQDGKGNVTLSPRQGTGEVMPEYVANKNIELVEGSGIIDGQMVANVRCNGCEGLDLSGSNDWIMAMKAGSSLDSTDLSQTITQHDSHRNFKVDFTKATLSNDANPFIGSGDEGNSTDPNPNPGNGSQPNPDDGAVEDGGGGSNTAKLILAHGVIMTVVFVAMYPLGSILMPIVGKWYIHATWQSLGFLLMWAGFGIGYVASKRLDIFFDQTHTRLGIFVVSLMVLQPIFGYVHHSQYRRNQRRGLFSYIHTWYGRALMILGIVNGGLGIQLADSSHSWIIGYSVAAAIMAVLYAGSAIFGATRCRSSSTDPRKQQDLSASNVTSDSRDSPVVGQA